MIPSRFQATIASQFATSPRLLALLENFNEYVDPSADLEQFYQQVWDLSTAVGYGLDVWGRIVGVTRSFTYQSTTYTLGDTDFRTLILVKALANIVDSSIPSFNRLLQALFAGQGNAWANDLGGMNMSLLFDFFLSPTQLAIVAGSGVMGRPAGVGSGIAQVPSTQVFGFNGSGLAGFDQAPFFVGIIPVS